MVYEYVFTVRRPTPQRFVNTLERIAQALEAEEREELQRQNTVEQQFRGLNQALEQHGLKTKNPKTQS